MRTQLKKEIKPQMITPFHSGKQESKMKIYFENENKINYHHFNKIFNKTKPSLRYEQFNTITSIQIKKNNSKVSIGLNPLSTSYSGNKKKSHVNFFLNQNKPKANYKNPKTSKVDNKKYPKVNNKKYPFLLSNKTRLKYLKQKDIDNVLNINTTDSITITDPDRLNTQTVYSSINNTRIPNVSTKKEETSIVNNNTLGNTSEDNSGNVFDKIKNKELTKILLGNISKQANQILGKKGITINPKKYSMTARFILKLRDPQDCIEEHIVQNIHPEDKFRKFKILLSRQKNKNLKLLNDLKETAVVNDNLLKVYMMKLLRNKIKAEKINKKRKFKPCI